MKKNLNKILLEAIHRGINLALDDFDDELVGQQTETIKNQNVTKDYLELLDYVVDLGLPSGTLWCKYNLGCDFNKLNKDPENSKAKNWYGKYYAWGEIETKNEYTKDNYEFKLNSPFKSDFDLALKYHNEYGLTQLLPEDDAAYLKLHIGNFKFHIPTKELVEELLEHTEYKWRTSYLGYNGLNGMLLKSKINENYIFLPAAGYYYISEIKQYSRIGNYWTSTLNEEVNSEAYNFWFNLYDIYKPHIGNHLKREEGGSIRPVINLK